MANLERMKSRRKEITDEQTALVALAEKEDREFSEGERAEFRTLQEEFEPLQQDITITEQAQRNLGLSSEVIKPETNGNGSGESPELRSLGAQFVDSEEYEARKTAGFGGSWSTGQVELRTLLDTTSGSGGDAIIADNQPGIRPLRLRRLTMADLILSGTTDSNSVTYVEEQTFTNAAAAVTEGDSKAESTLVLNIVTEAVRKIAHWIPVTDEMLEDVSQIRSFIDSRLFIGVQLEEEDQLLNGDGTAPNISGILDRTGLQTTITVGAVSAVDSVYGMITDIREAFYEPNGIVVHPSDWGSDAFRLAKDTALQYYGGGPFMGPYGNGSVQMEPPVWGLQAVVTPNIPAGTVLVGDFNQAQMFRKSGITVEASNSHSDYFIKNKTAIRAEERFALAVYAPGAFGVVDLTP